MTDALSCFFEHGECPPLALANIAILGAFAGLAAGGGLSNSA